MALLFSLAGWDPRPWVDSLKAVMPDRDIRVAPDIGNIDDIHYCLCWKPEPGFLASLPNLKAIFSMGAGVDHLMSDPDLPKLPISRIVDPDLTARMSEYACLHALMILRQQKRYDAQQQHQIWHEITPQPAASDVTVAILGLGEIGADAARKLNMLGFNVIGWSRTEKNVEEITCVSGDDGFEYVKKHADIIINILPLTDATTYLFDANFFASLKQEGALGGTHFINLGRGKSQKEEDLVNALRNGQLNSATLDVFEVEPLSPSSPLWQMENVTITPHAAGPSNPKSIAFYIKKQIETFETDGKLENLVLKDRRY